MSIMLSISTQGRIFQLGPMVIVQFSTNLNQNFSLDAFLRWLTTKQHSLIIAECPTRRDDMKTGLFLLLFVSSLCFAGDVTLTWTHDAPETVTGYEVIWTSSNGVTGRQQVSGDQFEWIHSNLDAGQSISYQLYAFNAGGYSDPTKTVTAEINSPIESPPNMMPIPIHIEIIAPEMPSFSGKCSVDFECKFNEN